MNSPRKRVIGIEFHTNAIRAVELLRRGRPIVIGSAAIGVPPGSIAENGAFDLDSLGTALKALLSELKPRTNQALLGLPPHCFTARVLNLPSMPDDEMRMVVQGELERLQVIEPGGEGFDFRALSSPDEHGEVPVLVTSARSDVLAALERLGESLNLKIVGVEPVSLGMMRVAGQEVKSEAAAIVAITEGRSDIALVHQGSLVFYRRVSIGATDLLADPAPPEDGEKRDATVIADRYDSLAEEVTLGGRQLNRIQAIGLVSEIQRSLEYHRRENPNFPIVRQALVTYDDSRMVPFTDWLGGALEFRVETAAVPGQAPDFTAAAGIGLAGMDGNWVIPVFDLSAHRRRSVRQESSRLAMGIAAAIVLIVAGSAIVLAVNVKTRALGAEIGNLAAKERTLLSATDPRLERIEKARGQLASLRTQAVPLPQLMDQVFAKLHSGASVSEIEIDEEKRIRITGEAVNTAAVISSVDSLRLLPVLSNVNVDSIDTTSTTLQPGSVRFFLSAQVGTAPAPPPSPNGTPKGGKA
ncbi:MAG: pilus assembly protein PilM [Fimbriimonadaceae bacterium]|nr:pilus assembly protein PilM [Fimbriimonadaceae bacterium]